VARGLREICGVLVANGHYLDLVETRNILHRPCGFWISPRDAGAIRRAAKILGHRVVGSFHSHVVSPAIPGPSDIAGASEGDLMRIIDTATKGVALSSITLGRAHRLRLQKIGRRPTKALQSDEHLPRSARSVARR
jgi:proteasome lid subunit RPN8/RPN11